METNITAETVRHAQLSDQPTDVWTFKINQAAKTLKRIKKDPKIPEGYKELAQAIYRTLMGMLHPMSCGHTHLWSNWIKLWKRWDFLTVHII